jgi:PA domain-containing protein
MNRPVFAMLRAVLLVSLLGFAASSASASVTVIIQNNDAAGVGFNDPTPVAPIGGNNGITLGQQRMNAFQFAANICGATLNSGPSITIRASWTGLTCTTDTAVLAQTGTVTIHTGFSNGIPGVWYGAALANALSGSDRNGLQAEISAQVNINLGNPDCFSASHWYLGLDGGHGGDTELVAVLIHEFAHGLGMQTFSNVKTGSDNGTPGIYDRFLRDNTTGKLWSDMSAAERVASAVNAGNLVWAGSQVTSDVPNVLGTPRLTVNSPGSIAGNYTVGTADFGPSISSPGITGNIVRTQPLDACSAVSNAGSISGNIAFIDRGTCNFIDKVKNAQNAGAIGVIIGNVSTSNNPSVAPGMGAVGAPVLITIPTESLNFSDAQALRGQLGGAVNGSIYVDHSVLLGSDSSGHALMYAPTTATQGSSVSHFDTSAFPNLVMEPSYSGDLGHSVVAPQDLTASLLHDLGWTSTPAPPPPDNDNFTSAQIIGGCSGNVNGTNVSATKETGEPNHSPDNNGGSKSVWYSWQAPATGSATITTAGSSFDTVLAVYTGGAVGSLTPIVKNDDANANDTTSSVNFNATDGTTYMIAVDGYNNGGSGGDTGSITLNWSLTNCGAAAMQIMLEEFGPDPNQAAAFDAILFVRDPFPVVNSSNFFSLPGDPNTRVLIFVTNLQLAQGETAAAVTINLIDSLNQTYNIPAQDVRSVPNQAFTQVTFRLPNNLPVGTCQIKVIAHAGDSNTATLRIKS